MKRKSVQSITCILLLFFTTVTVYAASEFPGRKLYLNTQHIELEKLHASFESSLIIDVRSPYEFQTLHISGACNIPIKARNFISRVRELQQQNKNKTLVTYCNGKTCMKSNKAAVKYRHNGINNVKVFDAGVLDWATTYPRQAVLLGKSPIDPAHIINERIFKSHLLEQA
jgi:predicted sulfurtransferase